MAVVLVLAHVMADLQAFSERNQTFQPIPTQWTDRWKKTKVKGYHQGSLVELVEKP